MKVKFVTTYPPTNCGIATYSSYFVEALKKQCEVDVIPILAGGPVYFTSLALESRKNVHVVHVQYDLSFFGKRGIYTPLFYLAVKLIGGPATVTTIHEFIDVDTVYRGKIRRYFMHLFYKMIYLSLAMLNDTIIVHTHDTIRLLSQFSRNGQIKIVPLASISNPVFLPIEDCKRKLGKVSVYTFSYERPPVDGIEVRLLGEHNGHGIDTNLQALLATRRLARELSKYDVLLIVNPDMGSMPAYHLAKRYNPALKIMWTFHGMTQAPYMSLLKDRWLMQARRMTSIRSMRGGPGSYRCSAIP